MDSICLVDNTLGGIFNYKLFLVFIFLAIILSPAASAADLIVDGGGSGYTTIQEAINAASPGDTIIVPAGTYAENVVLNKSVSLCGSESGEMPVVEKPGTSVIIRVTADGAVIENLAVAGSGNGYYDAGIRVEASSVEIRNCHLYNNTGVGIKLGGSGGEVEGCTLEGNSASDFSSGIRLINADNCHIFSNELRDFGSAAILVNTGSSDNLISGNTLTVNNKCISLEYLGSGDTGNTLVGNTCLSSKFGVHLSDCKDAGIVIRDGTVSGSESGVYINDSDRVVIDNMTIMESGEYGVELAGLSSDVTLTNSTIESTSTAFGISVIASSDSHIFNNIFNCTRNVIIHGSNPNILWDTDKTEGLNVMGGPAIGGNLWLTPRGIGFSQTHADTDLDGICDEEYEIDGANIDHLPLHTCIPTADFTYDPAGGSTPLDVQFTDASYGVGDLSRSWDFGSGTSADLNPSHTFADNGTYEVSLTVTSAFGSDTHTAEVTALVPPEAVMGLDQMEGNAPLTVHFTDDSAGCIFTRTWDFDDGPTSGDADVLHTFGTPGVYNVSLNVSNTYASDEVYLMITVYEAPEANFTFSPAGGNAPLEVVFNETSTGNVTSWAWEFGDGNVSSEQSPSHEYVTPGTYTVVLNASNVYGSSFSESTLTVLPPPVADFTQSADEGNAPLSVDFTDTSTGNVTAWAWDFGDGSLSAEESPSHEYTTPGTYTVVLNASNAYGSSLSESSVTLLSPPVSGFALSTYEGNAPLSVGFYRGCSGNVTSIEWDLGDGNSSAFSSLLHEYPTPGTYTVVLNASNPYGFDLSESTLTVLAPAVADFTHSADKGNAPLSVDFTDASTGNVTSWAWDFGDGNVSADQSPSHEYTTPGTYRVVLNASNPYGFSHHESSVHILPPPVADFSQSADEGNCPVSVDFTDASSGNVTSWSWDFGDGNVSADQSSSHEYTTPGTYRVVLNASNAYGFSLSESSVTALKVPSANFTQSAEEGNCPLTVVFTDFSTGNVTSWAWDFGDGNISAERCPSHEYAAPGAYRVVLNASNAYGFSLSESSVHILPPPVANFTQSTDEGNAPLTVGFTDASTGNVTSWSWDFGDGNVSAEQNSSHEYTTPGTYTIKLNASNAYGFSSLESELHVLSHPVANFTQSADEGNAPLTVGFTDTSAGDVTSWSWDFGDGNISVEQNPSHEYTSPGTYTITLNASNPHASSCHESSVHILAAPVADFSQSADEGNAPLTVGFTDASSGNVTSWSWDFGDGGISEEKNPVHTYSHAGKYTVSLTSGNSHGNSTIAKQDCIQVTIRPGTGDGGPSHASASAHKSISKGQTTSFGFTESAIYEVRETATADITDELMTVERIGLPNGMGAPVRDVYEYNEVSIYHTTDDSVMGAVLNFSVTKYWLEERGFAPGDVVIYRYHNETWNALPTSLVGEENGQYYFTATSPGFSVFAIGAEHGTEATPTVTPEVTVTATTTPAGAEATATQQSPVGFATVLFAAVGASALLRRRG